MKKYLAIASTMVAALAVGVAAGAPAVAADTTTVTVHVTSAGKALGNADVVLRSLDMEWNNTLGHTSAAGVATYENVSPGAYTVLVGETSTFLTTYAGNTAREVDAKVLTVTDGSHLDTTIKVIAAATVKGKVVDAKGHALKGVNVSGVNLTRSGDAYAVTNSKGAYVLRGLATGSVLVSATRTSGSVTVSVGTTKVSAKQGKTVSAHTIKTAGTAKITGKIKTSGSRVTTQGVTLLSSKKLPVAFAQPSSKGSVSFKGLKAGTYTVVVNGTNISKKVTVKAGKSKSFGTLSRAKFTTIKGVVKTSAKKPAAGAFVRVVDSFGNVAGEAMTNSKGRYSIKGLLSGTYVVEAAPDGGKDYVASVKVKATKGKNLAKNINLAKGSTVTGYVKHSGKGVSNVSVFVGYAYAVTDAHGKYTLTGVAPGKVTVHVSDDYSYAGGYRNASKKITVKKGKALKVASIVVK